MRTSKLLVAGGVLAGVLYLAAGRSEAPPPSPSPAPAPVAVAPAGELAAIRAELAQVRAERDLPPPALRDAPDAVDEPPAEPDPVQLADLVDAEPDDPAWSSDTERAIAAVIDADAAGSRLVDVTCRTSVCRVEVTHADPDTQVGFLGHVLPSPPFHAAGMAQRLTDPDDPSDLRTVIFLARGDQPLPL